MVTFSKHCLFWDKREAYIGTASSWLGPWLWAQAGPAGAGETVLALPASGKGQGFPLHCHWQGARCSFALPARSQSQPVVVMLFVFGFFWACFISRGWLLEVPPLGYQHPSIEH